VAGHIDLIVVDGRVVRPMTDLLQDYDAGVRREAEGRFRGRAETFRAVLVERFGEGTWIDEVAKYYARCDDVAASLAEIRAAGDVMDLVF